MKIIAIESFVLTVPTPKPMALNYAQQKLVVAEIATDEGVKGLGYSLVFGGGGAWMVSEMFPLALRPCASVTVKCTESRRAVESRRASVSGRPPLSAR